MIKVGQVYSHVGTPVYDLILKINPVTVRVMRFEREYGKRQMEVIKIADFPAELFTKESVILTEFKIGLVDINE